MNRTATTVRRKRWIYRHENELRRALAGWAVSQHPFHRPPMLFEACESFIGYMTQKSRTVGGVLRLSHKNLYNQTLEFCLKSPLVVRWNNPKKRKHTMVFASRYFGVKPEYDFIDLSALARNVTRQLLMEE